MKPLYSQIEFDSAKSRQKLPLECTQCGNPFYRTKNKIQASLAGNHQNCLFCSFSCSARHRHRNDLSKEKVLCEQCNLPFFKMQRAIQRTKHNFCCKSCAAKYNNAHKTKGTRVSKLERWLAEQLVLLFPDLEFHFNRKDAINGELDIYIPALKLAFELNGIFHYEPIYGPEKLASMQTNDHRKMLACAELGIELCVLDISSIKYFKPVKAQRFLDIATNLISTKKEV